MTEPVALAEIIDGLEMQNDQCPAYLDWATGRVELVTEDDQTLLDTEDSGEELDDWERERLELLNALDVDTGDRFVALPDPFEIHEWAMMKEFALEVEDSAMSEALLNAIHGRGAFRCFRDRIHELGVADQWHAYRDEQFRRIAVEWCEANGIEWTEKAAGRAPHEPEG